MKTVPKGKFKLANRFNGWESAERYESEGEADAAWLREKRKFYSTPGREDSPYCVMVIDAGATWSFDHAQNKDCWSL